MLAKNRDKGEMIREEIVADGTVVGVRTAGADYLGLGANRYGCAFVGAAINSPEWTAAAEAGETERAAAIYAEQTVGLVNPAHTISEALHSERRAIAIVRKLADADRRWLGYNFIVADRDEAYLVEAYDRQVIFEPLAERASVTNHFAKIPIGPRSREDYLSSFVRFEAARSLLCDLDRERLFEILSPAGADRYPFWRNGGFKTVSSSVIDFSGPVLNYLRRGEVRYDRYYVS